MCVCACVCLVLQVYETPNRMVRAHVHKMLGPWFNVFPDVRMRMNNEVSTLQLYRNVAHELIGLIRAHTQEKEAAAVAAKAAE